MSACAPSRKYPNPYANPVVQRDYLMWVEDYQSTSNYYINRSNDYKLTLQPVEYQQFIKDHQRRLHYTNVKYVRNRLEYYKQYCKSVPACNNAPEESAEASQ
ncbi:MAG: hypothetical protein HQM12_11465 [SAR324 cluster bacterium]|nr:hypothetical protein [SAR324 cluster bacterium]